MRDARVRNIVASSDPQERLSFLIEIMVGDELSQLRAIGDIQQRRARIREFFRRKKAPVLQVVDVYAKEGLEVTNTLEGTGQLILSGPAQTWIRAMIEYADLFDGPALKLVPNEATAFPFH